MAVTSTDLMNSKNEFNQVVGQQKGSALDKDSFMLLLVTQFKYQDPLNPMEDKEFIAQLAQFSSLEQLMNLNDSMGLLTDATNNQQMINATSYIGKSVMAYGTSVSKQGESVSAYEYAIEEDAVTGTISIFDSKDGSNFIYTETVNAKAAGKHTFTWDGKTAAGTEAPDGVYVVRMAFQNKDGAPIIFDSQVSGEVSGVISENGAVYLKLADDRVLNLANVRQVNAIKPTSPKPEDPDPEKPDPEDPKPEQPLPKPDENEGGSGDEGGDGSALKDVLRTAKEDAQKLKEQLKHAVNEEAQKIRDKYRQ